MSAYFAEKAESLHSIDVVDERVVREGFEFTQVESERIPFRDNSYDFVVSNQVIEHVPEQAEHVSEVCRFLRPGGVAYFATPKRFWPREIHSHLLGQGWLPRPLACLYHRWRRGSEWVVYPLSYWGLRWLLQKRFAKVEDYGARVVLEGERYQSNMDSSLMQLARRLPKLVVNYLSWAMPSFIMVVRKQP